MGNSASDSSTSNMQHDDRFDGVMTMGYRVLGVQPNSPASKAELVSFFDFIVGANGIMLFNVEEEEEEEEDIETEPNMNKDEDFFVDVDFPLLLQQNQDKVVDLLVFNIKSKTQRIIQLTPSNKWEGTGLLGVTIRADDYAGAEDRLLRILSVEKNSPAAIAGLTPLTDYLLGTSTESFENEDILAQVLYSHVDRVVEVYVYNTETDVVRVVSIMPTLSWGGPGLLGCEVGRGYLHRLPAACRATHGISFERKIRKSVLSTSVKGTDWIEPVIKTMDGDIAEKAIESSTMKCAISGEGVHAEPRIELETTDAGRKTFVSSTEASENTGMVAKEISCSQQVQEIPSLETNERRISSITDLPPPPQLSGYEFRHDSDTDVQSSSLDMSSPVFFPSLPLHLPTLSPYE